MPFRAPCRAITNSLHLPNDDEVDNTAQRPEYGGFGAGGAAASARLNQTGE
jgi:hypothetical protein